jgi:pimeloyl-ACP methyl ester carboxylesterase
MIDANGVRLRAMAAGDGPLVLMVHGFPESWYSWRHLIGPIAAAGFRACAIDVRGYGGSDKPQAVGAYAMDKMVDDFIGVAQALGGGKAILIGHDWGAPMVYAAALSHPHVFTAVAGLSVPNTGVPPVPLIEIYDKLFTERGLFFYQCYFQEEGVAEAELESDIRRSIRSFYLAISGDAKDGDYPQRKKLGARFLDDMVIPDTMPAWFTKADEDFYVGEFERSGFRGPLNRYRNHRADFAFLDPFRARKIEQPALFIGGSKDPVLKFLPGGDLIETMKRETPGLRGVHILEGCGHWTQQERPQECVDLIVPWLKGL